MLSDSLYIFIPIICFLGAYLSTVAGMGGGLLILAGCSQILPISAVVPLNGVLIFAGQTARAMQFHRHIEWRISRPFIPGSMIGAILGSLIYVSLPDTLIALMLACLMLWFCWVPPSPRAQMLARKIPQPYFWVGIIHTFLSTLSGVGGLLQSLMVNSKLSKQAVVGTIAGTLLAMSLFKTLSYIWAGFDYRPYLNIIVLAWLAGVLGTWLGKKSLQRFSDQNFRALIKGMVTIFSLRLLWQVAAAFLDV